MKEDSEYVKKKYENYMRTGEKLHLLDAENKKHYAEWFQEVIKENVQILVEEYGEERTEEDLGGFIALTDEEGIKELKENLLKNKIQ